MAGIKKLRQIQLFKEITKGTAGVATAKWRGLGIVEDLREPYFPDEDIGLLVATNRAATPFELAQLELEDVPATFEQLPYLLAGGIKKVTTGVVDGAGSGKVYEYPLSYQYPPNDFQTLTVESGDNEQVEFMPYTFAQSIKLSGKRKEPVMMGATMIGRRTEPNTYTASMAFNSATKTITDAANGLGKFTSGMRIRVSGTVSNDGIYTVTTGGTAGTIVVTESLVTEAAVPCTVQQYFTSVTVPTVEEILFNKTKFYADPVGSAFGTTEVPCTLWEFTLDITTGIQEKFAASGELYFCKAEVVLPEVTLTLKFEHSSFAVAQKALWRNNTPQLIRLKTTGSALAPAGTYTNKTLLMDLPGMWEKIDKIGDEDGNDLMSGTFRVAYDPTAAKYATLTVVNNLATLP